MKVYKVGLSIVRIILLLMITVAVCSDRASALVGRIVFVSDRDGKEELYVINPDGSDCVA
jgi:hypothetical protein